jgi:glycosyltransferase involved in cell wall biosynthesis
MQRTSPCPPRIGFVGTYVPRRCGIATFTRDVLESVSPPASAFVVAVEQPHLTHRYPPEVRAVIRERHRRDYRSAAKLLNDEADVVNLQHEFGIFGGKMGSHILGLTGALRVPLITTMHTVPAEPTPLQARIIAQLAEHSARLVVINPRGQAFLERVYRVPASKISVIPHGIPDLPFAPPNAYKPGLGLAGRTTLFSFGLLSPGKGFEHAIEALPPLVDRHPDLVYVIAGTTHPNERRLYGERYRQSLQDLIAHLKLDDHVRFVDRFLPDDELHRWLLAADVYLTPYPHQEQISSGTLAYAMGAGCVVASSAFWHASELLRGGRGVLVPPADSEAIRDALEDLLADPARRDLIRRRAYEASRSSVWPVIGQRYLAEFQRAAAPGAGTPLHAPPPAFKEARPA